MPRSFAAAALVAALFAVLPATVSARTPKRSVPQGFVGMNISDGALNPEFPLEKQMADMVHAGVESVIAQVPWSAMQPLQGGPIDFTETDRLALAAARLRMTFVPVVVFAPQWGAMYGNLVASAPRADAYGAFMSALVHRYGPGGALWAAHPDVKPSPIRTWQIWNEPELQTFWDMPGYKDDTWQAQYVRVLRAAHDAVKAVDRHAKIALAGLVNLSWQDLESLYTAGAKGLFDMVALHPYTRDIANVLRTLQFNRSVMNKHGDRHVPLLMTEAGWPPSSGVVPNHYGFEVRPQDLPALIRYAVPAFAEHRKAFVVAGFYWYTWATADASPTYAFDYAGLRTQTGPGTTRDKPTLAAFRRAALKLEGCRSKGATALVCRR